MKVTVGTANEDSKPDQKVFVDVVVDERIYTLAAIDRRIDMLKRGRAYLVKCGVK